MLTRGLLILLATAINSSAGQGLFSGIHFGNLGGVNQYASQTNPYLTASLANPYSGPGFNYGYNTVTPPPTSPRKGYTASLLNAYASSLSDNRQPPSPGFLNAYKSPISNLVNAYKTLYSTSGGLGLSDFNSQGLGANYGLSGSSSALTGAKTYGHFSQGGRKRPQKVFVPVVIHKSKKKKQKIITVQHGMFVAGGTQMFGKFKDLHSCKKACSITSTCFAGDFDPWLGKCFMHSNITACQTPSTHPATIHFKKVPCTLVSTTRGLITLGTQLFGGIEQSGVKDLKSCLKKCISAGGGIAPTTATIPTTPQLCFGIDYDFGSHKCYLHTDSGLCPATVLTPINLFGRSSSVNILLCPLAA